MKLKLYYVYLSNPTMRDWYTCTAIFENGWSAFQHVCSSPGFAPGDLWRNRKERQEIIAKMGIEVEDTDELIEDQTIDETHPDLLKANKKCDQKYWNDLYKSFDKDASNSPNFEIEEDDNG